MSSLRAVSNEGNSHDAVKATGVKRRLPAPSVEKASMARKENLSSPSVPKRSKRQKLSARTPPSKPPRYANPRIAELKKEIEREYLIRDGGAKLLQASKSNKQSMEASKGLFVSDAKIIGYMRELQHQQSITSVQPPSVGSEPKPCKARIAISEIRIPLEWREFEHIKGKMDSHPPRGVFCLFRVGNQVMDTPSLVEVDRSTMDILFTDTIIFPELVDPDFTVDIELYCSVPAEDSSAKPSTPIKMLKKLRHKDIKAEECPAPKSYTPRALNVTPTHRFALAGHAQLAIKDIADSCRTFALRRGMIGASGTASTGGSDDPLLLPLWGQVCARLMAEPDCAKQMRTAGFINVQRMVGGLRDWKRLWCVMRQNHLRCWSCPEEVGKKMPLETIDLTPGMVVESAPRLTMRRPNSIILKDKSVELFIAFESKEEKAQWMDCMNQGILDLKVWQSSCGFTITAPQSKFYTESPAEAVIAGIHPADMSLSEGVTEL